jgi:CRP/FNR family transcriptional regulator, cyclic AMP receptor protein
MHDAMRVAPERAARFRVGTTPQMRAVLDYCSGAVQRNVSAGTLILHEGSTTGHLFVLIEGKLEVVKGDSVVASITEPGAVVGEMSVLLDQPHTATVRAASNSTVYEFSDAGSFLRDQPAVALLIARLLAQRLNVATTYLADVMHQYAGASTNPVVHWHGNSTHEPWSRYHQFICRPHAPPP